MAGPLKDINVENPFNPDAVHFLSNYWSGHGYENFADTNIYGGPTSAQPNRVGFGTDGQGSNKNSSGRYDIATDTSLHSSRTITPGPGGPGGGWEHNYSGPQSPENASSCVGIANSIATINKQIKEIRAKRNALRDSVNKIKSKKSDLELQAWGVDAQKGTLTGFQTENNGTIQTIEDISPSINSGVEYASIETEELVLHYDARSEKSYDPVGMGTVVYEQASVGYGYTAYLKGDRVNYSSAEKAWEFTGTSVSDQGIYIDKLNYVTGSEDEIPHLTIEAWIKANSANTGRTSDERTILSFDRSAVFRFALGQSEISGSAGKLCFSFTNRDGSNNAEQTNDTFDTSTAINLRDNNWHQVAVTFDSEQDFDSHGPGSSGGTTDVNLLGIGNTVSKITYYIDGNVTHEINGSGGVGGVGTAHSPIGSHDEVETPRYGWIGNGSEAVSAGASCGPTGEWNMWSGFIGNVKYYNEALTDEQIQQNFNALKVEYGLS